MSERIQQHIAALNQQRAFLDSVLDQIGARGDEQLYSDGAQWTLRQLCIHLAVADKGHNNMIWGIAQGENIIPEDYDVDRFNKRSVEKRAEMSLDEARQSLRETRAALLDWLSQLDDESVLDREGRHATLRIMSISQMLDGMAVHERDHADDIARHLQGA